MYKLLYYVLLSGVFWDYDYVSECLVLMSVSGGILCVSAVVSLGQCGCSVFCKTLYQLNWVPRMWDSMHLCMLLPFSASFNYVSNE
jgi:hypothetical protein